MVFCSITPKREERQLGKRLEVTREELCKVPGLEARILREKNSLKEEENAVSF